MPEPSFQKELLVPLGIFGIILILILVAPPLGMMVGILIPMPLMLIYLHHGKKTGLISVAAVFVAIGLLAGAREAVGFVAEYAAIAVIMAETIRLGFAFEKSVFFGALGSAVLSGLIILAVASGQETGFQELFKMEFQKGTQQYIDSLEELKNKPAELAKLRSMADRLSETMALSFPAILVTGSLFAAVLNYLAVRAVWLRVYSGPYFKNVDLVRWSLPENWVWFLIVSAAMTLMTEGFFQGVGLNLFLVLLVLYFLQGLVIVLDFLKTRRVPRFFWFLAFILIFTQPLLVGLVAGLGLFDIWIDFRKLKVAPADDDEEDEDSFQ